MTSKPSTPLEHRRAYPGEMETTRIPLLSPQPFRRAHSLRMRTSQSFHDYQQYREGKLSNCYGKIMPHLSNGSKAKVPSCHKHDCHTCTCAVSSTSSLDISRPQRDFSKYNGHVSSLTSSRKGSLQPLQRNGRSMVRILTNPK
jgi:hypothetical protein